MNILKQQLNDTENQSDKYKTNSILYVFEYETSKVITGKIISVDNNLIKIFEKIESRYYSFDLTLQHQEYDISSEN